MKTLKVGIGKRVVELADTDKNFWLLEVMKHIDANIQKYNGRVSAKDLAKIARQMSSMQITHDDASKLLKELFEVVHLFDLVGEHEPADLSKAN